DHFPAPMQAGNPSAQRSKADPHIGTHPSMGAVAARFRGPNDPALPAFVGFGDPNLFFADVLGASPMGGAYEAADGPLLGGPPDPGPRHQRSPGGGPRRALSSIRSLATRVGRRRHDGPDGPLSPAGPGDGPVWQGAKSVPGGPGT